MHTGDGIRFIDLEKAALGNGYTELAYLRTGFPTCWCAKSVPEPGRSQAETAYHATWRSMTGAIWPAGSPTPAQAGDPRRRARRARPSRAARLPDDLLHQDWSWDTATARQRLLHRLTAVTAVTADHPGLASLAQVSQAMRDRIRQRWPGTRPLPAAQGSPIRYS